MTSARLRYVALALGTMAIGLGVHWSGGALPPVARDVLGDALWAMMVGWWVGAAAPAARPWVRITVALAFSYAIELSQLYREPWLDALRENPIALLVLGSGFDPRDLVAYTAGVLAAALIERSVRARSASGGPPAGRRPH